MKASNEYCLAGTLHFSYRPSEIRKAQPQQKELTPSQKRLVELIPYYPEYIRKSSLFKQSGLVNAEAIISCLPSFVLIAEDEDGLTRLKEDLSNV